MLVADLSGTADVIGAIGSLLWPLVPPFGAPRFQGPRFVPHFGQILSVEGPGFKVQLREQLELDDAKEQGIKFW
jgi:hypothetical protein